MWLCVSCACLFVYVCGYSRGGQYSVLYHIFSFNPSLTCLPCNHSSSWHPHMHPTIHPPVCNRSNTHTHTNVVLTNHYTHWHCSPTRRSFLYVDHPTPPTPSHCAILIPVHSGLQAQCAFFFFFNVSKLLFGLGMTEAVKLRFG